MNIDIELDDEMFERLKKHAELRNMSVESLMEYILKVQAPRRIDREFPDMGNA